MNKIIKEQLEKLTNVVLPSYDDNTTEIIIPKQDVEEIDFELNKYYHIELEDYIIHPFEGFNLHQNWNHNIIPKDKRMNVEVIQLMGKMIKITGVGENSLNTWEGWVPKKSIKILNTL